MLRTRLAVAAVLACIAGAALAADTPELVRYQLGLLRTGPAYTAETGPHADSVQAAHLANIGRMHALGALVAAGPFEGGSVLAGALVFAPDAGGLDTLLAQD